MPMFKRSLVILSLSAVILPSIMLVIPESVSYITPLSSLLQNIYDCISCQWWGIHHGPPWMSLFLSTSTPYPGIRLRNQVKYLGHACLYGRLPRFQHGFTSLTFDWNISSSVRIQVLYSHSMVCTEIPSESLTSMVISLTLVNSLHYWIGNQVVSTMFNVNTL